MARNSGEDGAEHFRRFKGSFLWLSFHTEEHIQFWTFTTCACFESISANIKEKHLLAVTLCMKLPNSPTGPGASRLRSHLDASTVCGLKGAVSAPCGLRPAFPALCAGSQLSAQEILTENLRHNKPGCGSTLMAPWTLTFLSHSL